jgi:hypothetical protein
VAVSRVADIFRPHGPAWRQANAGHVCLDQLKVIVGDRELPHRRACRALRGLRLYHHRLQLLPQSALPKMPRRSGPGARTVASLAIRRRGSSLQGFSRPECHDIDAERQLLDDSRQLSVTGLGLCRIFFEVPVPGREDVRIRSAIFSISTDAAVHCHPDLLTSNIWDSEIELSPDSLARLR